VITQIRPSQARPQQNMPHPTMDPEAEERNETGGQFSKAMMLVRFRCGKTADESIQAAKGGGRIANRLRGPRHPATRQHSQPVFVVPASLERSILEG